MAGCNIEKAAPGARQESGFRKAQTLAGCETKHNAKIIDFQTGKSVALGEYRREWLRRKIHVGPALAAFLAEMAFQAKGGSHDR